MDENKSQDLKIDIENSGEYSAEHIEVLDGLKGVRKRPAMYIGDIGIRGLHHLIFEVVDNSIDEALAGFCKQIKVTLNEDGSVSVEDDGRGIPVEKHKVGKSALEVVMTVLHAGGKFSNKVYKVSGGLHGVGVSVVNALSQWCEVKVKRNGKIYYQRYEKGVAVTEVKEIGNTTESGTTVTFLPDKEIFESIEFDPKIISKRLEELAYLNKGIRIIFEDKKAAKKELYHYSGGIIEYLTKITHLKSPLHPLIYINKSKGDFWLEVCIQYCNDYSENILTYVNSINTIDGGTHLAGLKSALAKVILGYIRSNQLLKEEEDFPNSEDIKEGLNAILSIKIPNPNFEGQTKTKLANSAVKGLVESIISEELKTYFEEHPSEANAICQKVILTFQARLAAQKSRELVRRKGALESTILPGKLADCSEQDPTICELFIVEGDSAGGSAKQARDRKIQAVLPLRGKILNVEKASLIKILQSKEIKNLISAIGTGFAENFDISKLRYHKIIIMTDADVDGSHIRTLLLTLFYRYLKPLIEKGHVFIAQPPLYKLKVGNFEKYIYSDKELEETLAQLSNPKNYHSQRYKGLGEMNPQQLWQTTMDPKNRNLIQVTIEDAKKANEIFEILLGEDVEPRKQYISAHAKNVRNLDI
ncbi:MAG: DNA topoisomerase (ATP-hydrolyzing) subunit B [Candidatus Anstonellaceae archaeon]